MQLRQLGSSSLQVPVIGMGTWKTFDVSRPTEIEQRRQVVDAALASEMRLFDSSPMYGAAEKVLGKTLEGRRDQALIATKVWTSDDGEAQAQIQRALGFYDGRVELYQVHNLVAWQTRLRTLEGLQQAGQVSAIGVTHYRHAAFGDLMDIMRSGRIQAIQVPHNVRDREVERRVLPLAAELGIGVLTMVPLGAGALTQRSPSSAQLEPFHAFGVRTWAQVLLKWLVSDERVTAVIPATSSVEHARDNAAAGEPPWFGPAERADVLRLAETLG